MDPNTLLAKERRARMAAERLLELKQVELREANRKLSLHALSLSDEIVEQRAVNEDVRSELQYATDKIEAVERRLWDSIETIPDGFAVFDPDGTLVVANSAYVQPFDGLTDVAPGITYRALLRLAAEEGIVDTDGMTRADWIDQMLWRWGQASGRSFGRAPVERCVHQADRHTLTRRRHGQPCAEYHRYHPQ
ncbi:MAG: PAS-domain containing protein [Pseudomonadota bacterium]